MNFRTIEELAEQNSYKILYSAGGSTELLLRVIIKVMDDMGRLGHWLLNIEILKLLSKAT